MKRILARRPTPALVIASIALFVSLGGVSYGVATGSIDGREIKDNSIRSKDVRNNNLTSRDLRNNQVRGIDIRNRTLRGHDIANNSLTRHQIRENKLDKVPEAAVADAATLAGQPPSAFQSTAVEPVQPAPGAASAGDGMLGPGFWRDRGVVHLQGTLVAGAAGVVFTLPAGYRPGGTVRFAAVSGEQPPDEISVVTVEADGRVSVSATTATSLDGMAFRAGG